MPVGKYFAYAGSALLALLFVFDACFGDHESNSRFDESLFESATYAPRFEEVVAAKALGFTRDVTPASRVKEVFAQFVPSKAGAGNATLPPSSSFGDVSPELSVTSVPNFR